MVLATVILFFFRCANICTSRNKIKKINVAKTPFILFYFMLDVQTALVNSRKKQKKQAVNNLQPSLYT